MEYLIKEWLQWNGLYINYFLSNVSWAFFSLLFLFSHLKHSPFLLFFFFFIHLFHFNIFFLKLYFKYFYFSLSLSSVNKNIVPPTRSSLPSTMKPIWMNIMKPTIVMYFKCMHSIVWWNFINRKYCQVY